jgi:DNA end-binding protein Ku
MWKGIVRFEDVAVPVRLYSAVQDRGVHFRMLHADDRQPVQQQMVRAADESEVPRDQIRKGYVTEDAYVVLEPNDLAALEPPPSRDIDVVSFVPPAALSSQWFEKPYYLGPDGEEAGYAALAAALEERGVLGIARWVMRKRPYVGSLHARDGLLLLARLHYAEEVVLASALDRPTGRDPDPREVKLAQQLVGTLEGHFEPERYHDTFRAAVLGLVDKKKKGQKIKPRRYQRPRAPRSLTASLERSLEAAKKGRRVG